MNLCFTYYAQNEYEVHSNNVSFEPETLSESEKKHLIILDLIHSLVEYNAKKMMFELTKCEYELNLKNDLADLHFDIQLKGSPQNAVTAMQITHSLTKKVALLTLSMPLKFVNYQGIIETTEDDTENMIDFNLISNTHPLFEQTKEVFIH